MLLFALIYLPKLGFSQDTLYFDTLVNSGKGSFYVMVETTEFLLKDTTMIPTGHWEFFTKSGKLIKEANYTLDLRQKASVLNGEVKYYDTLGDHILSLWYRNDQIYRKEAQRIFYLMEGNSAYDVKEQYGKLLVFEHLDRFAQPKIVTEYVNLRSEKEMAYYFDEEERLSSPHLLREAANWPNVEGNLVDNAMFEKHPLLAESRASIENEVTAWKPASPTPDFFYSEDCKSGTGCVGFRVYSLVRDIEYLQNRLVKPLKKDSVYCFSLYVKLANQCALTSNGLGIHFSKKPIKSINEVIDKQPNLLLNESYLPYKSKWMLLQCQYKAQGGEKYLTIGSFKHLRDISLTPVKGYQHEAYYIMDDLVLLPISDSTECTCNLNEKPAPKPLVIYDTLSSLLQDEPLAGDKFVLENIYFENDEFQLLPQSMPALVKLKNMLIQYPTMRIEIAGHTSNTGGYDHNLELSYNRAKSVKQFLIMQGIAADRLRIKGYADTEPIASNDTPEGQAKNRRVEVEIIKR
ncbi:MAG: OmpA family protein [Flavobacteriales bacterium]|nr:OmpA family protein [Flavobacteriales bacterium]